MERDRMQVTRPFLFVGNHPCFDFINTELIVERRRTDLLVEWPDLIGWVIKAKLFATDEAREIVAKMAQSERETLLTETKAFRAVLREMAEQIVAPRQVPGSALEIITRPTTHKPR